MDFILQTLIFFSFITLMDMEDVHISFPLFAFVSGKLGVQCVVALDQVTAVSLLNSIL